ncbi:MAG: hypothetical protein QM204_00410 [Bacillota bacterium]|jgi:hypothetical protein|nr:hypothetical protein [Bacillota bacterium]NLL26169.1 hypothetical protein [Erysipelotrichia bacterium]
MKKNKEKKNFVFLDERQSQIAQKASANGYLFLVIYLIAISIYKITTGGDPIWEVVGIFGSAVVVIVSRRLMGDIEQPTDYLNRPLPTGNSRKERNIRLKNYIINSILFGLSFAVMDAVLLIFGDIDFMEFELVKSMLPELNKGLIILLSAVMVFAGGFIASMIFEYLIGEYYDVRRYNKMIAKLDEEENN